MTQPAAALLLAGLAPLAAGLQTTLLGTRVRIAQPWLLWLAPLALLLGALVATRAFLRQRAALALVPPARRERLLQGAGVAQGTLRGGLLGTGLALLCLAAAGPQCGERTEMVKRSGLDLVVALDASASMLARDVRPSRLERARLEISALLDRLKGDRVGIVVFAGEAFVQCPLTVDYSAARLFLRAVDPQTMPQQGTAVAAALQEAKRVLDGGGRPGAAKVVVLVSDGEDQEGAALEAAQELADSGIHLFTVPVGSEEGEPIPLLDKSGNVAGYKKDREGRTVLTRTDVSGMRDLAARGGGALLRGQGADLGLASLLPELDRMQRGDLESRLTVQYDERYAWFAWPAFALLCLGAALGEGPLRPRRRA
jgi:Ca-activated chloride channel family protein